MTSSFDEYRFAGYDADVDANYDANVEPDGQSDGMAGMGGSDAEVDTGKPDTGTPDTGPPQPLPWCGLCDTTSDCETGLECVLLLDVKVCLETCDCHPETGGCGIGDTNTCSQGVCANHFVGNEYADPTGLCAAVEFGGYGGVPTVRTTTLKAACLELNP